MRIKFENLNFGLELDEEIVRKFARDNQRRWVKESGEEIGWMKKLTYVGYELSLVSFVWEVFIQGLDYKIDRNKLRINGWYLWISQNI